MAQEIERTTDEAGVPRQQRVDLAPHNSLNLEGLPPDQIAELRRQHATGMIDVSVKAQQLKVEVGALDAALSSFTDTATKATQGGAHATISHTQTTSLGRTEVVIGNTDRAKSAKLSASASGVADRLPWIIGIVAIAAVLIAMIAFHH